MATFECQYCEKAYLENDKRVKHEEICPSNGKSPKEQHEARLKQLKEK